MKKFADAGRLFPQDEDGRDKARVDWIDRLAFKAGAEVCLEKICNLTEDRDTLYYAANALHFLQSLYDICEAVIARHEARGQWDSFRFLHRQLMGLALEFTGLASRRPEQACSAFKAEQLNRVLEPLKKEMEADMGTSLPLVPEDGSLSYSDVAVLLRSYQDVCASYVRRHYDGNPPVIPPVPSNWTARLIQDQILVYCTDEPKSVLQIGDMLGYKDKKTVRKYLNPLLDQGLLARTVPDKPNSRNQRYITARNV